MNRDANVRKEADLVDSLYNVVKYVYPRGSWKLDTGGEWIGR